MAAKKIIIKDNGTSGMRKIERIVKGLNEAIDRFEEDSGVKLTDKQINELLNQKLKPMKYIRNDERIKILTRGLRAKLMQEMDIYYNRLVNAFASAEQWITTQVQIYPLPPATAKDFIHAKSGRVEIKPTAEKDLKIINLHVIEGDRVKLYEDAKEAVETLKRIKEELGLKHYRHLLAIPGTGTGRIINGDLTTLGGGTTLAVRERAFMTHERKGLSFRK